MEIVVVKNLLGVGIQVNLELGTLAFSPYTGRSTRNLRTEYDSVVMLHEAGEQARLLYEDEEGNDAFVYITGESAEAVRRAEDPSCNVRPAEEA